MPKDRIELYHSESGCQSPIGSPEYLQWVVNLPVFLREIIIEERKIDPELVRNADMHEAPCWPS